MINFAKPIYAWIYFLMVLLQPKAPWKDTYELTAIAIGDASESNPLFSGQNGIVKTAAVLISLAWFESRFDPNALGDKGKSHGLFQQQGMGDLSDPKVATVVALQQIKISFRICSNKRIEEKLGWYAAGGPDCERGLVQSKHRMLKAFWLVQKYPFDESKFQ